MSRLWGGVKKFPDEGQKGIDKFIADLKCNHICKALELGGASSGQKLLYLNPPLKWDHIANRDC